jgi:phospholipid/cholesterol/gamma-HCH transport system permease protein
MQDPDLTRQPEQKKQPGDGRSDRLWIGLRPIAAVGQAGRIIGRALASFLTHFTLMARLISSIVARLPLVYKNVNLSVEQMYSIGITSIPLVTVISVFLGSVTVTQAVYQFSGFVPLRYLGVAVCKSLVSELCPVVIAMVVSGRISTAIAAEIGSMKNTEQLDAMTILSLDPIRYLVVPKTLACIIMLPVLVVWSELVAFVGSIVTVILTVHVSLFTYLSGLRLFFTERDVYTGIGKTAVFGAVIAIIGCHFGYQVKGGAEGVGSATTKAVMVASALILVFDFVIAFVVLR